MNIISEHDASSGWIATPKFDLKSWIRSADFLFFTVMNEKKSSQLDKTLNFE